MKNKIKSYPFAQKNISKIVFVSGNTRSGKAVMLKIIASLKGVEKVNFSPLMEQANFLTLTNNISKDAAIYFQRRAFSILDYNLRIGREINFRKKDFTSIYEYRNPKKYLKNLKSQEGDKVIAKLKKEKSVVPIMIHHGLSTPNLFSAFDNFVFFEMIRNPVSIVYSWLKKGYDEKFYYSYRVGCLTLKYKNKIVPYYAHGWEKKYLQLNKYEKVIEIFLRLEKFKEKTLKKLNIKDKKKINYIRLEDLYINPLLILNKIEKILKKRKTNYTNKIFKQEKLPRTIDLYNTQYQKEMIKKKVSSIYFKKLLQLENKYFKIK